MSDAPNANKMRFTHHPRHLPFEFIRSRTYTQERNPKPVGWWLSVDDDWRRWCDSTGLRDCTPTVEVDLDLDRVLLLDNVEALDEFDALYVGHHSYLDSAIIDWEPLTKQYAGIVIAPHQPSRSHIGLSGAAAWYYGWDVASGCVWDLSAIRHVGLVEMISSPLFPPPG